MKKYFYITSVAVLALASCSEEQELVNAPASQENRVLTATFEQNATTRMHIDAANNNALNWSEGDKIHAWDASGNASILTLQSGAGTASAIFEVTSNLTDKIVAAAFHTDASYNSNTNTLTMNNLTFSFTQEEEGVLTLPMWGEVNNSGNIEFKHLAGLLKVNLSNVPQGYNKLVVTTDKVITGEFSADVSQNNPIFKPLSNDESNESNKTVTITFNSNSSSQILYLPIPVNEYEYIEVSVTNGTDTKILKKWTNKTVERAKVYSTSADISTYVTTAEELENAVADENTTVVNLGADITLDDILAIEKAITLNGNGFTLTSSATRAINVNHNGEVTIKNLTIATTNNTERAINVIQKAATLQLDNVKAEGFKYTINVAESSTGSTITINGGTFSGYAAMNITGSNTIVTATDVAFHGVNNVSTHPSNNFAVISIGNATTDETTNNVNVTIEGGTLTATSTNSNQQAAIQLSDATDATIKVDADLELYNNNVLSVNMATGTISFKADYKDELEAQYFMVSEIPGDDMITVQVSSGDTE